MRCIARWTGCLRGKLALGWRMLLKQLHGHHNIAMLYAVTAFLVLPYICHHMPHSIYYVDRVDLASRQRLEREANTIRLLEAKEFLANASQTLVEYPDIAISIISVSRNRKYAYKPRYLTQAVAGLLRLSSDPYRVTVSVCNVDYDAASYTEAANLASVVPVHRRFQNRYVSLQHQLEKEKSDYVFCLNYTLHTYRPRFVLLVEDDALPRPDLFSVISHLISSHIDNSYERGEMIHQPNLSNLAYIKLFHPERLVSYYSIEPERIPGLIAMAIVIATVGTFFYRMLFVCARGHQPSHLHTTWIILIIYVMLVSMAIGRVNIVSLRRLLSPHFHLVVPAPSCCTPAVMFPAWSAPRVIAHLNNATCRKNYAKDSVLDELWTSKGMQAWLVEPNLFTHIGMYSSLHSRMLDPLIV